MTALKCTYNSNRRELLIEYPEAFNPQDDLIERERLLNLEGINGRVKESIFNGICIEQRVVSLNQPLRVDIEHDYPLLKMHFELKGYSSFISKNKESLNVEIQNGMHQLFFFPKVEGELVYKEGMHRETIEITLSLDFIERIFHDQWELLSLLGTAIKENIPIVIGSTTNTITQQLYEILDKIIHCPVSGALKPYYLEAKVIELLIIQIQDLTQLKENQLQVVYHPDHEKMTDLSLYLKNTIGKSHTIEELAKDVGMNTSKLKKAFKSCFGETIFTFQNRLRMEYAYKELQESEKTITTIASETGYNYVQHFSKAFKKFYGYLPSELRSK